MQKETNRTPDKIQKETYSTLEEIQLRREQLMNDLDEEEEVISDLWHSIFKKNEDATKGDQIMAIVNNTITAIDAFLLVRKLAKNYSSVLNLFNFHRRKKKR
jgi:hypothetical protein